METLDLKSYDIRIRTSLLSNRKVSRIIEKSFQNCEGPG